MRGRLLVAVGLVALLAGLAGCASFFGPGQPDPGELNATASYDWDTNATTTYNVSRSSYTAVIETGNRTSVVVYQRDELGTDQPLTPRALQYRFADGTVISANHSALGARTEGQRTNVTVPEANGSVAFTASRPNAKRFATPVFVEGSHEVVLPPRTRVGIPLLSQVSPPADHTSVTDSRMTVRWADVDRGPVVVRYYLQRDILLFGGLGAILVVAGVVGALYYYRQIRTLEKKREEIGLDVETEDDDLGDDGPPPGMR
ncbi:MAG: DUF5803 family protein [Haloarculaceae archaeon]